MCVEKYMITFAELGKYGRLGNQLFQYAALKSLGMKKGYEVKIPNFTNSLWHGQECLLSNFNIEAAYMTPEDYSTIQYLYVEPNHDKYDETFFQLPDNLNIHGFFQFIKYFEHCEDLIRQELSPKDEFLSHAKKKIISYKKDGHEIVSIHIRRGDLMTVMFAATGIHPDQVYGPNNIFDDNTIYGNYLNKAMSLFENRKVKYLVFSGGSFYNI